MVPFILHPTRLTTQVRLTLLPTSDILSRRGTKAVDTTVITVRVQASVSHRVWSVCSIAVLVHIHSTDISFRSAQGGRGGF